MLFNSFDFLVFLPVTLIAYYSLGRKSRWVVLLLASYYFYATLEPRLIVLLWLSTITDYLCGLHIHKSEKHLSKKIGLLISCFVNLGLLFFFKYLNFAIDNIDYLFKTFGFNLELLKVEETTGITKLLLPIGISFYTFQTLGYTIDVYRGNILPEKHLGKFALYVSFFPQLVAGPIEKAKRLLPQLNGNTNFSISNFKEGLCIMAWGFFLKIVVADRLGIYVDEAFLKVADLRGLPLAIGAFFFSMQIYYDFAGYTSIAIGIAKLIGIDLVQNFNRPFFSVSASQFWQRWHISLMVWLRDYIYLPLRRKVGFSRLIAVLVVFFVNGLWHGASWTYIVWSLLNAVFLIIEIGTQKIRNRWFKRIGLSQGLISFLGWASVIGYLIVTLIIFRASSINHAILYFKNMLSFGTNINILENYLELSLCFAFIFFAQLVHYNFGSSGMYRFISKRRVLVRYSVYVGYVLVIVFFAINRQKNFIYFQF